MIRTSEDNSMDEDELEEVEPTDVTQRDINITSYTLTHTRLRSNLHTKT